MKVKRMGAWLSALIVGAAGVTSGVLAFADSSTPAPQESSSLSDSDQAIAVDAAHLATANAPSDAPVPTVHAAKTTLADVLSLMAPDVTGDFGQASIPVVVVAIEGDLGVATTRGPVGAPTEHATGVLLAVSEEGQVLYRQVVSQGAPDYEAKLSALDTQVETLELDS